MLIRFFTACSLRLIALFFLLTLSACSTVSDPVELYKNESIASLFASAEASLRAKDYNEAIKRFEALQVQYPFGLETEIAQLHIIYAYYKAADFLSAEAAADRFIQAYPANQHVDYAYLLRGLANYQQNLGLFERFFPVDLATRDLTPLKKAYDDFAALAQTFPHSIYTPMAHQYLLHIRTLLATHQLEVANYYYNRHAYVAAANRANLVVRHYQGTKVVPHALVLMIKAYRKLRMTQLANDALTVLRYNYPHSIYVKEVSP